MSLFTELQRRNVFKVAIAYMALAWLVIQITDMAVPALNLPEELNSIVFYLGMIGLPFALFFAWAFELTPEGLKPTEAVDPDASITPTTGSKIDKMIIAFLSLAVIALAANQFFFMDGGDDETPIETSELVSIAVLPFADMSADKSQEYFGDGIAEELLNVLVRIDGLRVPSRTSSFAFKEESSMSAKDIGAELQVDHVLEGSIRTSGDTVRVTAQLIDVKTDTHLWSNTYDRELSDIFAIQDEISGAIVSALKVELGKGDTPAHENTTTNMEAYAAYLKGITAFGKRSGSFSQFVEEAIAHFEEATRLDPTYADAWAAYGRALAFSPNYSVPIPLDEAVERSKSAIKLALLLDPDNVSALTTTGVIQFQYDADFDGAAATFEEAIKLSPNDSDIYNFYGDQLYVLMDYDMAVAIEGKAYALDPSSVINQAEYMDALFGAGRIEEAIALAEKHMAERPDLPFLTSRLIDNLMYIGRRDEAMKLYEAPALDRVLTNSLLGTPKEFYLAMEGDMEAYQTLQDSNYRFFGAMAEIHFAWGEYDKAAEYISSMSERSFNYFNIRFNKTFDPRYAVDHEGLKAALTHPKFKPLMDKRRENLGLPAK